LVIAESGCRTYLRKYNDYLRINCDMKKGEAMSFNIQQINEIKLEYNIDLPTSYAKILLSVGGKIKFIDPPLINIESSIHGLQQDATEKMECLEEDGIYFPSIIKNAFFIMSSHSNIMSKYYFILPSDQKDSIVYVWKSYDDGENSVEEVSSTISGWLLSTCPLLYMEWQVKTMFDVM
jgi:hypothetical protein